MCSNPEKHYFLSHFRQSFFLLPISLIESNGLSINKSEILLLLLYAIFSQTIAQGLITYGFSLVSAHLSSLVLLMQPVAAAFYGWLLLEEIISPMQAIGGMIVLLAIYAASRKD